MKTKKRSYLLASLSVLLVCALVIGGTLAYLTAQKDVTNVFKIGNIDLEIEEPKWPPVDPPVINPGDVLEKDPVITALDGEMYFRIVMTITELDEEDEVTGEVTPGAVITDGERLALILDTLYNDKGYDENTTLNLNAKYAKDDLSGLISSGKIESIKNLSAFTIDTTKSGSGVYYYNYTLNSGLFEKGDSVYFMTHVVVPTDYDENDLKLLAGYQVTFTVQAIQASNFTNLTEAMTALDAQLATA